MASRVLGLVRDSLIAYAFPVAASDAFFVAFTIPNLFRRLVGEGSLTLAFVPLFSSALQRSPEEARRVFHATWTLALLAGLAICLVGMWFADPLVVTFAPGYAADPVKRALTGELLRLLLPVHRESHAGRGGDGRAERDGSLLPARDRAGVPEPVSDRGGVRGLWLFDPPIVALAWGW